MPGQAPSRVGPGRAADDAGPVRIEDNAGPVRIGDDAGPVRIEGTGAREAPAAPAPKRRRPAGGATAVPTEAAGPGPVGRSTVAAPPASPPVARINPPRENSAGDRPH